MDDIHRFSIRIKVALSVFVSIAIILGVGYWITRAQVLEHVNGLSRQQLSLFGETLRESLVGQMENGADNATLQASTQEITQRYPDVIELHIIHGASLNRQFGMQGEGQPRDETGKASLELKTVTVSESSHRLRFTYPIIADQKCMQCHVAREGEVLGAINLLLDTGKVDTLLEKQNSEILVINFIEISLLIFLLTWILNRLIFKPLTQLGKGAERLGKGDFSELVTGESTNELGVMVSAFNQMMVKINSLVKGQEEIILEQTRDLTHLMETSQYIDTEEPLSNILHQFSKVLAEIVRVSHCRILMVNEDAQTLELKCEYPIQPADVNAVTECGHKEACPNLWKVVNLKDFLLLQIKDTLAETELGMLGMHGAKSALCVPIMSRDIVHGIVVLSERRSETREPIDAKKIRLCQAIASQMGAAIELAKLYQTLVEQLMETVLGMAETVEKKSPWTAGHSKRVTKYALMLAEGVGWQKEKLEELHIAGLLHDIGKIGVPGSILNKQGRLSEEEYSIIKRHPDDGAQILSKIRILRPYIPIVRHHHEWFDGNGYPDGLRGTEIPIGARILAIADAYDAITADRPYRQGRPQKEAIECLEKSAGTQFDPELIDVFKRVVEK